MKTIKKLIIIVLIFYSEINIAQDVMNPYINLPNISLNAIPNEVTILPPSWVNQTPPWYSWHKTGLVSGYAGEYEINLGWHPWFSYSIGGPGNGLHISYGMEIVSFPFTPDCGFLPTGCSGLAGTFDRNLYMPTIPYDSNTDAWGGLNNKFYQARLYNNVSQTLASYAFQESVPLSFGTNNKILPHTVIKHTVYVHCGPLTVSPPYPDIVYSFSWLYDNTRGRMRFYPFCACNSCPGSCSETEYDITFVPEILNHKDNGGHYYNENDNTILLPEGSLDYFPFNELQSLPPCNYSSQTILPGNNNLYTAGGNTSNHPYFPPYSLISAPALQWRGSNLAGYEDGPTGSNTIIPMGGLKHTYHIDRGYPFLDLTVINPIDKIIYNPSEVVVVADVVTGGVNNVIFPTGYAFKTILGRYPSLDEVTDANNNLANGGPYTDPRDVPVPVNAADLVPPGTPNYPEVSWDDPATAIDDRYGYYYIENLGQITVEPCVKIFDAKFEVGQGGTLFFEDYTQTKNPDRYTITSTGGVIAKNFQNVQYLQNTVVTQPQHIPYIAVNRIYAGENVDPNSTTISPYTLESGSDVEFIAGDAINLNEGFSARYGSVFHASCVSMVNPTCPAVWRSGSRAINSIEQSAVRSPSQSLSSKLIISPNPVKDQVTIRSDNLFSATLEIIDIMGRKVINQAFNKFAELNFSGFNSGIYFARLIDENGISMNANIIKQ